MSIKVAKAPLDSGRLELGRSLPSLLDEAVRDRPNATAFNQRDGQGGWRTWSTTVFAKQSENLALGLRGFGLEKGARVALFTESDMSFVIGDMGCLIGGLVDVPIYLTHTDSAIRYILEESNQRPRSGQRDQAVRPRLRRQGLAQGAPHQQPAGLICTGSLWAKLGLSTKSGRCHYRRASALLRTWEHEHKGRQSTVGFRAPGAGPQPAIAA